VIFPISIFPGVSPRPEFSFGHKQQETAT